MDLGTWLAVEVAFGLVGLAAIVLVALISWRGANLRRSNPDLSSPHVISPQHWRQSPGLEGEPEEPERSGGRHAA